MCGLEQFSRYGESLWAGRSGDRIPVWKSSSTPIQTGPVAHTASCTMHTLSFPKVKQLGRGIDHPPPSSAEFDKRKEPFLYSHLCLHGRLYGEVFCYHFSCICSFSVSVRLTDR